MSKDRPSKTLTSNRQEGNKAGRDLVLSAIAATVACAVMYGTSGLLHTATFPDLFEDRLVLALPGPLFGFLIDNLQHAGKVLSEAFLDAGFVFALALLGTAFYRIARQRSALLASSLPVAGWLVINLLALESRPGPPTLTIASATSTSWFVVFFSYGISLWVGQGGWSESAADPGRRRALRLLVVASGSAAVGILTLREVFIWSKALAPDYAVSGLPPALTPVGDFYLVSKNLADPAIDASTWMLQILGECQNPGAFTLSQLTTLPSRTEFVTLECISNPVGGKLMSTGAFTGVALKDLVKLAIPTVQARSVNFRSRDGYTEALDMSIAMSRSDILVAYSLNGGPLPAEHGYPARVVVPGRYGMKSPKWLDQITLAAKPVAGFWEEQGWDPGEPVHTTARIDLPSFPAFVKVSDVALGGVAFAGTRGISAVEWSVDSGKSWRQANLESPLGPLTWQRWTATWSPDREGIYTLLARARDGTGQVQTSEAMGSYPRGANGYHSIIVVVEAS